MVFYKSSYPPSVRVWLKVVPSFVLTVYIILAQPALITTFKYKNHEHLEKGMMKSNRFELLVRQRNDYYRNRIYPLLDEQPGQEISLHKEMTLD